MKYKKFCDFAKTIEFRRTNKKLYVVMARNNSGNWHLEVATMVKKTKQGIFVTANSNYFIKDRYMKIMEVDLDKADVLFEGYRDKENNE